MVITFYETIFILTIIVVVYLNNEFVMSSNFDFSVTTNGKIIFYDSNWNETTTAAHQFNQLSAIAFDETEETIYFNDQRQDLGTIFSLRLSRNNKVEHKIETILEKTKNETIEGLAYDPLDRILYWTDSKNKYIFQLYIQDSDEINNNNNNNINKTNNIINNNNTTTTSSYPNGNNKVKIFKQLADDQMPKGISIDVCRRKIYWTNVNYYSPTIERATLNGEKSEVLINTNLFRPFGIVVDQFSERIYWVDDKMGIHFSVESAALDGTDRQMILKDYHFEPFNLAVDKTDIYFTDKTDKSVLKISKNVGNSNSSQENKITKVLNLSSSVRGITARTDFLSTQESNPACKAVIAQIKKSIILASSKLPPSRTATTDFGFLPSSSSSSSSSSASSSSSSTATTTSTAIITKPSTSNDTINKYVSLNKIPFELCFNNGIYNRKTEMCICTKAFKGSHCEIPICHNYCIRGACYVSTTGFAKCHCTDGFSGDRCENDMCTGYCLNGGHCNLEEMEPVCHCAAQYFGRHCEMNIDDMCKEFCEYGISDDYETRTNLPAICNCNDEQSSVNLTSLSQLQHSSKSGGGGGGGGSICESKDSSFNWTILVLTAGVLLSLSLILIIVKVSRKMYKPLRPRIKKTFVVRKNINPTPLTSRPSTEQCEITIENCCNMNYCDTPCFDPQKIQEEMSRNQSRKEDKKMLLNNIDDGGGGIGGGDLY